MRFSQNSQPSPSIVWESLPRDTKSASRSIKSTISRVKLQSNSCKVKIIPKKYLDSILDMQQNLKTLINRQERDIESMIEITQLSSTDCVGCINEHSFAVSTCGPFLWRCHLACKSSLYTHTFSSKVQIPLSLFSSFAAILNLSIFCSRTAS